MLQVAQYRRYAAATEQGILEVKRQDQNLSLFNRLVIVELSWVLTWYSNRRRVLNVIQRSAHMISVYAHVHTLAGLCIPLTILRLSKYQVNIHDMLPVIIRIKIDRYRSYPPVSIVACSVAAAYLRYPSQASISPNYFPYFCNHLKLFIAWWNKTSCSFK